MKAIIEFSLPEEKTEFELCIHAHSMRAILGELQAKLRNKLKYAELDPGAVEELEELRHWLAEEMVNANIPEW